MYLVICVHHMPTTNQLCNDLVGDLVHPLLLKSDCLLEASFREGFHQRYMVAAVGSVSQTRSRSENRLAV